MDLSCIIESGDLELYVMGLLPEEDSRKIEELSKLFPQIRAELDAIAASLEKAAMDSAVTPTASLKEKMMASLPDKNEQQARVVDFNTTVATKSSSRNMAVAASWVFVILLAGLSGYLLYSNNNLHHDIASLKENVNGYQSKIDELNTRVASFDMYRRLKNDKNITAITLASTKISIQQHAEVFWNKQTQELYIDFSALPQVPAGKQYQLWFIKDGTPIDAGVINLSDSSIIQKMKNCPAAQTFAITIEKEGGSPTPTLDQMVVAGNVG